MSRAKCIMVQGTMSGAGKSLLCAALCRIFAQDGLRTVPFKSQNMALNSFVTKDGLEMGRAQVVQAQAAGVEPDVRMNPILLKPSSDVGSQVIVNGEVRGQMKASEYFRTKRQLVPDILKAYDSLAEEADVIVIEGAGSPAEINLKSEDIVNMGLAEMVDAPVLLVGDIDRGGVFAQLYGTVELLEEKERRRIKGLVINKFRGDVEILRPGLSMLEEKTHLPVVGVVPYLKVDIEDEDSLSQRLEMRDGKKPLDAAIIRLPHLSNFTDFMPLEQHPLLGVRYVSNAHELGAPDLILLPGTKNTVDDLLWLRQCGLETALLKLAAKGTPVLGVCGGYQMLGQTLDDPTGSESGRPQTLRGLGLLPTRTVFSEQKRRAQVKATAATAPFAGAELEGYEIHTGVTEAEGEPFAHYPDGGREGCVQGNVFGTYLHGLFDTGTLTEALAGWLCRRKGIDPSDAALIPMEEYRRQQFDILADGVRGALDMDAVYAAMGMEKHRMEQGLLHLYWGDGKGKTTAAMGLALRALGSGKRVVIVQFLKGGNSGEIPLLAQLGAEIYRGKAGQKFVFQMTPEEKAATRELQNQNLAAAIAQPADLLILDEAGSAEELDMVDVDLLKKAVLERPAGCECVLTAHTPPQWMLDAADYSTEMKCHRHPYQKGIKARKGIEY